MDCACYSVCLCEAPARLCESLARAQGAPLPPVKAQETFWSVPAEPGPELGLQIAVELAIGVGPVRPQIAKELAMSF